jgi:hypothetical protein
MRVIQRHASWVFTFLLVGSMNSVQTLKAFMTLTLMLCGRLTMHSVTTLMTPHNTEGLLSTITAPF